MKITITFTSLLLMTVFLFGCGEQPTIPTQSPASNDKQTLQTGSAITTDVSTQTTTTATSSTVTTTEKQLSSQEKSVPANDTAFVPLSKTCFVMPPAKSSGFSVNAGGTRLAVPSSNILTSDQAIPKIFAKAREWSQDAKLSGGFVGGGTSMTPADVKLRVHYGEERGAVWAWSTTFYSPSKKQEINVSIIDNLVGGYPASIVNEDPIPRVKEFTSLYENMDDMISSCQAYEVAKANGLNEEDNYYIILTGDFKTLKKYPGRKTWVISELSRTDTNNGQNPLGKVIMNYAIDGVTGQFLEKKEGEIYGF